ncbi:MAG: chemotaxis protein histidine kinase CheA [Sulfitobacter sp.]|jgi:chemotaxis protein histidine kinase CheA
MMQAPQDANLAKLQAGLAKIKDRFVQSMPERVAEFDALLDQLYEDEDTEAVVDAIGQRAHKLHGQAGSVGFAEIGNFAAKLEHEVIAIMDGPRPLNTETVEAYLVAMLDQIDASLNGA